MLRFYPKIEKEYADQDTYRVLYHQACDCGRGTPTFQYDSQTHLTLGNCAFCRYRDEWVGTVAERIKFNQCVEKHKCEIALYPMVEMASPLNDQWDEYAENPDQSTGHYIPTPLLRQVTIEGQPLYIQFHLQFGFTAKCNAFCFWHNWRLQKKKTWRQCGYAKKCLNDGSGWALMAPSDPQLFQEFAAQF